MAACSSRMRPSSHRPRPPAATVARCVAGRGGHRHAQGRADRLDPEAATVLVDVAAHLGRSGSSSLAKNTLADSGSRSHGAARSSWRSRLISSAPRSSADRVQALVGLSLAHTLRSARGCPNQRPHARSGGHSQAPAALRARAAPRGLLGLDMTAENLLSPGQHLVEVGNGGTLRSAPG